MPFRRATALLAVSFTVVGATVGDTADLGLVPQPHHLRFLAQRPWRPSRLVRVRVPAQMLEAKGHFRATAAAVKLLTNGNLRLVEEASHAELRLTVAPELAAEAYALRVQADGVEMEVSSLKGLAHATATLLQLLGQRPDATVPALEIQDRPDCAYRSFMVDLGRNPHSLQALKETVDLLWFYKVDSLHLHLTDDQRFAFPSRAFPKLVTEKGKITWDQFAELERYAHDRGVTIIPELEVPGHSSKLRRIYPEVFGKTPTDLAQSETARRALKVLLDEAIELFPSSPYVHLGGDEAYGVPHNLQRALINDLQAYLKTKGKTAVVWEGPPPGADGSKVDTDAIYLNWQTTSFPADRMLQEGYRVVNAAWDPLYIVDHYPRNNFTMASPRYLYETLQLTRFRHFNPGMPTFAKPVETERSERLIGFCMPWWEGREENFARMCFPRVVPMAEVAWHHDQKRDYHDFAARRSVTEAVRQRAFYPVAIVAEALAVPEDGVFHQRTQVALRKRLPYGEIRYTADGSQPDADSALYRGPLPLDRSTTLRAALFVEGLPVAHDSRLTLTCVQPVQNLALGKRVTSNRTSGPPFSLGRLTDGGVGKLDYYLAYPAEPDPVVVTVDLGRPTPINRVCVVAYSNARAYESYRVLVGRDGQAFAQVADRTDPPEHPAASVNHDFEQQDVRFIRVESHGCKQNVFGSFSRLIEIQAFRVER